MTERCSMHLSSDNNLDRNCNLLSLERIGSEKGLSVSTSKVLKSAQKFGSLKKVNLPTQD